MFSKTLPIFVVLIAVVLGLGRLSLAGTVTPEKLNAAIEAGKKVLYSSQLPDGSWELNDQFKKSSLQDGGVTCMCVYALLTTGESEKDPRLAKAIKFMLHHNIAGTYSLCFEALALGQMQPTPEVRAALQGIAKRLADGGQRKGIEGLYFYNSAPNGDSYDFSNSQYGALGMWACVEAGVDIKDKYWEDVQKSWRKAQLTDGAWAYTMDVAFHPTISMTAAGIATLFMAGDQLASKTAGDCHGNTNDAGVDRAIAWLARNMKPEIDAYSWFGIERIGIASGYKSIGGLDWFAKGSEYFLNQQKPDGSWEYHASPQVGTSFALLFLYRGKGPIVINKLRYSKTSTTGAKVDGLWNQRNRDAAGVTKFVGEQLHMLTNWQIVNLDDDQQDLHDSPILYITGSERLDFSPEQIATLRKFVEDGGLLVGNADCGSKVFSDSFKTLCKGLFENQYDFRPLPADHPIYKLQQFPAAKWKTKSDLLGMSNEIRELAILMPTLDPSKAWQTRQSKTRRESFEVMSDLYLYSVGKSFSDKGETYIVKPSAAITATSTIKLARLAYAGNWDPEPGAFRRLAAIMHNENKIDLKVDPIKLGAGQLMNYQVAHLTGTAAFTLDDASRDEIKKFVAGGGTLIIDAGGGTAAFADAAEKELTVIFGDDAKQIQTPLKLGSAIYGNLKADDIRYRGFVQQIAQANPDGPQVRAIQSKGRAEVIFSREDISTGLVGQSVDGVYGYRPETSAKLMASFIQSSVSKPIPN